MADCVFCKIINGEIPCVKVYEDKEVLAFLDISPVNKGHTLVIPKKHYEVITEVPQKTFTKLMAELHTIATAVVIATNAEGFNIINNNKKVASQEVPHVHFHIIPRFSDDTFGHKWPTVKYSENEIEEYRKKIEKELKK